MLYNPSARNRSFSPPGRLPGHRAKSKIRLGLFAGCLVLLGCRIVLISGPSEVSIGETVTYVLEVSDNHPVGSNPLTVLAEVPLGWQPESITYVVTIEGKPVSGEGLVVQSQVCNEILGDVRPGFRRWHIEPDSLPPEAFDVGVGEVTLEFFVENQPADEFELFFVFGASRGCSVPAVITINRQGPEFLTLVQGLFDNTGGVDGLDDPREVTLSPDGHHLYVASMVDKSIAAFSRDETSGELTFIEAEFDGVGGVDGLGQPRGARVSPDGQNLYVVSPTDSFAGPGAIAVFVRDETTGELGFVERLVEDHVENLAISPDGRHLYAASSDEISLYLRDETGDGELTLVERLSPGGRLTISPDGRHLYVADRSADSIHIFSRDETTGELTWLTTVVDGVNGVEGLDDVTATVVSPHGGHLYSVAAFSSAVARFERDPTTGQLSFVEAQFDLTGEGFGISPQSLTVSRDGRHLAVGGRVAIVVFQRDQTTGQLTLVENQFAGNLPIDELSTAGVLAFDPTSSRHFYAVSSGDDALLAFETSLIFADGFESGTTSAWSVTVP